MPARGKLPLRELEPRDRGAVTAPVWLASIPIRREFPSGGLQASVKQPRDVLADGRPMSSAEQQEAAEAASSIANRCAGRLREPPPPFTPRSSQLRAQLAC